MGVVGDDSPAPVTVVVSTLDRPARLARCLDALLAGRRAPQAVVVVDQGAGAELVVARARARGLPVHHLHQSVRGLSISQNAGVRVASTPIVALVDDDCVPDDRWVEVVELAFAGTEGPLLLTGRVLPLPPEGDRTAAVSTRDSTTRRHWQQPPLPWELGTGGNFAVTRDAYEAAGGNDERLGTGGPGRGANDLDLFYRLVATGTRATYEPDLVVRHERSTVAEHGSRRFSYGFGVGAMLGLWLGRRETIALRVLVGWLRLRLGVLRHRRTAQALGNEARVLAGTAVGLLKGLQLSRSGQVSRA